MSTGVSEQMRAINTDTCASSVLDEPKLAGDGFDAQIQSKLVAATAAATAEVSAVGATAFGEFAPVAPCIILGQEWSTEDMADARAKIAELEAATVQLKAEKAGLEASVRMKDTALGDVSAMSFKVPSSSGVVEEPAAVYAARRAKKGTKTVSSAPVVDKSAEPRRLKPFTGEGDQDQAGAVFRFCNALSLFFELSNTHPDDWAMHGRTCLDGTAADYMHTAMHALPATERTWATFCALLGTRFGQIDPDTEFWDQLKDLKQASLPAAQYVHNMQYCLNGITELPVSAGEKFSVSCMV